MCKGFLCGTNGCPCGKDGYPRGTNRFPRGMSIHMLYIFHWENPLWKCIECIW